MALLIRTLGLVQAAARVLFPMKFTIILRFKMNRYSHGTGKLFT
jgi:hypothetical protein